MPPEQARGNADVDLRSDLYSLGAILYTCLAGRRPYDGSTRRILADLVAGPPEPLRALAPGLPDALYRVIDEAMAHERDRRFPDAPSMHAALAAVTDLPASAPVAPVRRPAGTRRVRRGSSRSRS
jgi:serine/threonine protein kinase